MMKKVMSLLVVLTLLFLAACNTQEIVPTEKVDETPTQPEPVTPVEEVQEAPVDVLPEPEPVKVEYVESTEEYFAMIGDTFQDRSHEIKVVSISGDAAVIEVNGEKQIVSDGHSKEYAGGFRVRASQLFSDVDREGRSVTLEFPDAQS